MPDLIRAVDRTLESARGRFPVYADPVSGEWQYSGEPEWNGGFWPGLLWLASAGTGEDRYAMAAGQCLGPLRARTEAPTILRGFMFFYGAALGVKLGLADPAAAADTADAAVAAARSLSAAFVPAAGVLSPGAEDAALYGWPSPGACVDGLPGAVPLLAQAAHLSADLTGPATEVADWYLANIPLDLVCFWEFHPGSADAPRDTSTTAIAAAALVKLAPLAGERYRAAAADTLQALSDGHRGPHGGLIGGCYQARTGLATRHELIWGDYFALEAALALAGRLDSTLL